MHGRLRENRQEYGASDVRGGVVAPEEPCSRQAKFLPVAAVMVAVFFTFALSGPLPPKEMGIILGVAVLLDALLVRLLLLPVLLRLTGNAAWWTPGWLKRVLPPGRFAHE
jgi:hypothetical protein